MQRRFFWLGVTAIVLIVLWSAGHAFLVGQADQAIAGLAQDPNVPVRTDCQDRETGGYPFRIEVRCSSVSLVPADPRRPRIDLADITGVALIYNPGHGIVEAASPATIAPVAGPPIVLNWRSARASGRYWPGGFTRLDAVVEEVSGFLGDATARQRIANAAHGELHIRANPDEPAAFDGALTVKGLQWAALPNVSAAIDVLVTARPADGVPRLAGTAAASGFTASGARLDIQRATIDLGPVVADISGMLTLDDQGLANGDLQVTMIGAEHIDTVLTPVLADPRPVQAFAGALTGFGAPAQLGDRPGRRVKLTVVRGSVRLGLIPLGRIPPIRR